jgi:hypothetical protein
VEISEQVEPQVAGRFALPQSFVKPREHDKSDVYMRIPFLGMLKIGKPYVLGNIAVLIFWFQLIIEKAQRVNYRQVKFIHLALFCKPGDGLADINEQFADKIISLGKLHLYNESVSVIVHAVQVEHGCPLLSGFVYLLVWEQNDIFNPGLQVFPNEGFYEGNEHGFALLRGKDPFESEINDKRSEAGRLCKLAWGNSGFFGHKASFEGETEMSYNKAPENRDVESGNIENYFREAG